MNARFATLHDAHLLATMNHQLIADERHRIRLTVEELESRMSEWLSHDYKAVIFEHEGCTAAYALYREDDTYVYLRQFFVCRDLRRQGIGRAAIQWLRENAWCDAPRIRLDVLVGNHVALEFWRSVGFCDYCVTLEMETN